MLFVLRGSDINDGSNFFGDLPLPRIFGILRLVDFVVSGGLDFCLGVGPVRDLLSGRAGKDLSCFCGFDVDDERVSVSSRVDVTSNALPEGRVDCESTRGESSS